MRWICVLLLLTLASRVAGQRVEGYVMGADRFEPRQFRGGKTATWVEKHTGAYQVHVGSFYGKKTVNGKKLIHMVDLLVYNYEVKIEDHYGRAVLAFYEDGMVRIFPNFNECLKWGMPKHAIAGIKTPPEPDNPRKMRQFWAVKGNMFFWVELKGTQQTCLNYAKSLGFESIVHMDGGSSLDPGILHPSFILVFCDHDGEVDHRHYWETSKWKLSPTVLDRATKARTIVQNTRSRR